MPFPIPNYTRIKVRGHFVDLAKATREESSYGLTGSIQFIPTPIVAINQGSQQIIEMMPFVTFPDPVDGYFEILLPSTDDPDIVPVDWNYKVIEPTGRQYYIVVPYDTPKIIDVDDDDYDTQVIDLVDVVPDPASNAGTIQLLHGRPGRDITSVDIDGNSHLVGTYSDNTSWDAGQLPVASVAGRLGDIVLTKADVGLNNVNNTADANKPISSSTQTALDLKADSSTLTSHTGNTSNPHGVTKAQVGLGSVDNVAAAVLQDRSTHTGTQATSTVTGLDTALTGKAATVHTHVATTDLTATGTKDDTTFLRGDNTWAAPPSSGGGVTDHGSLTGLLDDDHTQYLNNTRGDARYQPLDLDLTAIAGATGTKDDTTFLRGDNTWAVPPSSGGGVTDHGSLTGLTDDDHTQYHNDTRGDVRYYTKTAADTLLTGKQPADSDLTAIAALTPTNDDILQRKSGAWTNRTVAQVRTDLAVAPTASPTFTGTVTAPRIITPPVTLTDASTIAIDASLGNHFTVTLGGNRTLGAPTNPTDGQKMLIEVIQDGTGTRTLGYNAVYGFGTDITSPTLTTGANKRDFLGFVYNSTSVKWYALGVSKGY